MNMHFYLKEFLENKKSENITATQIAKKLNISKKTLSNYANGDAYIPLEHLNSLSNIYDINIDYLLGLSTIKNYPNYKKNKILDSKLIGKRLKEFRKESKLTQEKLANLIGVNKSSISRYEKGENLILTICLYTICQKYKISADYLIGKIDEPQELS